MRAADHLTIRVRYHLRVSLVRAGRPEHDMDALRARLDELETVLAARAGEIARATSDLAAFRLRYRREVGRLHEELEELERAIAEAELGELSKLANANSGQTATPEMTRRRGSRRTPSAGCSATSRKRFIPTSRATSSRGISVIG
jgi:hypothetical protein